MVVARWRWALVALALGAIAACGSEDGDGGDNAGAAGSGGLAPVGTDLDGDIKFSPVYSSFDGVHTFKVPVTVKGYSGIRWETDKPDLVDLEELNENTVMITTRGAGEAKIIARAGNFSGSTTMHITASTDADWKLGETRYTMGTVLMINREEIMRQMMMNMGMPGGMFSLPDDLSCKNCHGGGAMALSVEHTPQQTGGYSDDELIKIFTMGMKPPTAGWKSGIPMPIYTLLHTWTATEEEKRGLVAYIRSLTPASQGPIDFGGIAGD